MNTKHGVRKILLIYYLLPIRPIVHGWSHYTSREVLQKYLSGCLRFRYFAKVITGLTLG